MTKLRIGIIGCGEVVQVIHLPSLHQLGDLFTVTALCDMSSEVLQAVGEQWNIPNRCQDYSDLLARADVDAVLVASPDAYHAEAVLAAIAAGKHVLVEKPMCISPAEAYAIIAAQAQAGVTVQVGYMRRYAPAFVEACRLLPALGSIRLARAHAVIGGNPLFIGPTASVVRGDDIPAAVLFAGKQRRDALIEEAIGPAPDLLRRVYSLLLGLSSHDLSALRELLGPPQRVLYAAARRDGIYLTAALDYGDFICHFETGIDNIPRFDAHLEVYGVDKVLRVQYNTPYVRNLPITLTVTEANRRGGLVERSEHPVWGDAFVEEWRAFHHNVTTLTPPKTSPADFRQDLLLFREMINAMRQEHLQRK